MIVSVHIIGRHNNAVFEDRDVEFALGEGISHDIVDGVEHALTKFHKNEKSVITMNSVHAYGSAGCPSKNIPANAEVEYVLTLKEFESVSWYPFSFTIICVHIASMMEATFDTSYQL